MKRKLEKEIVRLVNSLEEVPCGSEEYSRIMRELTEYSKAYDSIVGPRINPNTIITGGVSILGILLITFFEDSHCVTSKALSFIQKPKM